MIAGIREPSEVGRAVPDILSAFPVAAGVPAGRFLAEMGIQHDRCSRPSLLG